MQGAILNERKTRFSSQRKSREGLVAFTAIPNPVVTVTVLNQPDQTLFPSHRQFVLGFTFNAKSGLRVVGSTRVDWFETSILGKDHRGFTSQTDSLRYG